MSLKLSIKHRQIALYIFMVFFCYLFIFQYCLQSFYDEIAVILLIPILSLGDFRNFESIKLKKYVIPVIFMCILILLWSTEGHKSFLYYLIMAEVLFFINPTTEDYRLVSGVLKRTSMINAFFVMVSFLLPNLMSAYARLVFSDEIAAAYVIQLQRRQFSGINNHVSFAAVYIVLGMLAYLYDQGLPKSRKIITVLFLFAALMATNKRAHLVYLLVAMLVVLYFSGAKSERLSRGILVAFAFMTVIALLYFASFLFPNITVLNRLASIMTALSGEADANMILSGRVAIYRQEIELFLGKPWVGIGWQNYADFSRYRSISGFVNQGHNVFLQLLCETGITGFAMFFLINFYYVKRIFRINSMSQALKSDETKDESGFDLEACKKCAIGFMVFYYLFWLSGNALYDFPFVYTWVVSILLSQLVFQRVKYSVKEQGDD